MAFLSSFLFTTFIFLSLRCIICRTRRILIFLSLNCCLTMSFRFFSDVFSNAIRYSKRMEILSFSVSFCPSKPIINSLFSRLLSRDKGKKISCFLISFNTSQLEFFLLIAFLIFWPVICSTLNKRRL